MSKVTIKFWDRELDRYSFKPDWYYFINKNSDVFCESADGMEEQFHIEPHFYKDGERIA